MGAVGRTCFRAAKEAVRDDLNCDFRRVGFFGVLNGSIGGDSD